MNKQILDFLNFYTPTSEQVSALESLSHFITKENNEDFFILSGAAGTGKTSITSALIGYLNEKKSYTKFQHQPEELHEY